MFRANPAHTGEMPGPGPLSDPHIVWQFETGGVRSSPAVVNGTVFVGALDGTLYAIDAATGVEQWRFLAGGYVGSPAVFDDIVLVSGDGGLFALDADDGTEIWSATTEGASLFSEATIADNVAYVGGYDGYLYAIAPYTGDLFWEFRTDGRIWIAPAVADEIVYARSDDGNLYAVDVITGEELWRSQIGWSNESSAPAVADGVVYVGGADGVIYALDTVTGEERWQAAHNGITDTSPAVVDGVIYIGNTVPQAAGALLALDAGTGDEIWRLVVPAGIASSASVTHGVAYFGDWDSVLHAVDTASGEELWQLQIDDGYAASSPAIVDGTSTWGRSGARAATSSPSAAHRLAELSADNWQCAPFQKDYQVNTEHRPSHLFHLIDKNGRLFVAASISALLPEILQSGRSGTAGVARCLQIGTERMTPTTGATEHGSHHNCRGRPA